MIVDLHTHTLLQYLEDAYESSRERDRAEGYRIESNESWRIRSVMKMIDDAVNKAQALANSDEDAQYT